MDGTHLNFGRGWSVGRQIGSGGFGQVYLATADNIEAVAKFIPKEPGADRELLFVDLPNVRNVVPVIDHGEYQDFWVLVMPRAQRSLRDYLQDSAGPLTLGETLAVLADICAALTDLDGRVVHRDLKPENILQLEGVWCLADFGISRYAEAATAEDTRKYALSPPYAAPERWRGDRASSAADVYAVGAMTFEMLSGSWPFSGPAPEDFREQHLHEAPPQLQGAPPAIGALVAECLYKAPEARPGAANLAARLGQISEPVVSPGLARLQVANRDEVERRSEVARAESQGRSEAGRRAALFEAGQHALGLISVALREAILMAAPATQVVSHSEASWELRLRDAELRLMTVGQRLPSAWGGPSPVRFDVICSTRLELEIPRDRYGYNGRGHSLWYGDIQREAEYRWFETAFMITPLLARESPIAPFALDPGPDAGGACGSGMAEYQVAWPFTSLAGSDLEHFIDRWAGWFADAAEGQLTHPGSMPELPPEGSWRRS